MVPLHPSVPFTVTKPATNREMSISVESRDVNFVFETSSGTANGVSFMYLDCR